MVRILTFGPVLLITLLIAATANGSGVITGFSQNCAYYFAAPGFSEDGRYMAYNDNAIKRIDLLTGATSTYPNNSDYGVVMSGNGQFMVYRS